jgi:hypothetical protein
MVPRRSSVRSIDITGVMPLPPTRNSVLAGGGSGSVNSPAGAASRTIVPGASPRTRWSERKPSGMARTVIVMSPRLCVGTELREYDRQWKRPSTSTPMPMYCPASWSNDQPHPGRITSVAESSVSGTTCSMRPRSSRADHSGLISER